MSESDRATAGMRFGPWLHVVKNSLSVTDEMEMANTPRDVRLLAGAATSIVFVATNTCCCDTTRLLSRQKYVCRDKTFVATKLCLLRQNVFWRDKTFIAIDYVFVATSILLSAFDKQ